RYRIHRAFPSYLFGLVSVFILSLLLELDAVDTAVHNRFIKVGRLRWRLGQVAISRMGTLVLFWMKAVYTMWKHPTHFFIIRSPMKYFEVTQIVTIESRENSVV